MAPREMWVHALGAKMGGGATYLRNMIPSLVRLLADKNVRLIILVPDTAALTPLPPWVELRTYEWAARTALRRLVFDQVVLPFLLARRNAVLCCTGNYAPLVRLVPTMVLIRNAIYFDQEFLCRESWHRSISLRLQGFVISAGARASSQVHYPSHAMRELVQERCSRLRGRGRVNPYGVGAEFVPATISGARRGAGCERATFLYVMNYTLQKNLGLVLRALVQAQKERLGVRVVVTSRLNQGPRSCFRQDRLMIERHDLIGSGYLLPIGPRHGEALLDAYREADALLFPSLCESFGHPLVEAMAVNLPVVAANLPYAREACGPHAIYVDPWSPEELVDVWRHWPACLRGLPSVDQGELRRRFSWDAHVRGITEVLLDEADMRGSAAHSQDRRTVA